MKRVLLLYFSLFTIHLSFSQSWQPLAGGITTYGAGLAVYKGSLYVGGTFDSANGQPVHFIASWNGSQWDTLGRGIRAWPGGGAIPYAYDSLLFVSGEYDSAGNLPAKSVAQWDGSKWDTLGPGIDARNGVLVRNLTYYNKDLYAVGDIFYTGDSLKVNNIVRWNGAKWDSVGSGTNNTTWCLAVYKNKLYVGGFFTSAGGISAHYIASWDGTKWDSVGGGANGGIYTLTVYNGRLYAGGFFSSAGGIKANNIASWDGSKWDSVGGGVNSLVYSLISYNGNLYAGGEFDSAGGKPAMQIAKWDGNNWYPVGKGLDSDAIGYGVMALGVYDSTLYACGDFTRSGSTIVNNIASWRDSAIITSNETVIPPAGSVQVYPNPVNTLLNVVVPLQKGQTVNICLYNSLGEVVRCETLSTSHSTINTSNLAVGLYYYRITDANGTILKADKQMIIH